MKIVVSSNICWDGATGGSASSSVEGCGAHTYDYPDEKVISGVFQLKNKCDYSGYTESCESGTLTVTAYHTNGSVCEQASTIVRYGVATVGCSEF